MAHCCAFAVAAQSTAPRISVMIGAQWRCFMARTVYLGVASYQPALVHRVSTLDDPPLESPGTYLEVAPLNGRPTTRPKVTNRISMLLSALQPPASSISSILPFSIRSQLHVGSSSRAPHLAFALALAALITAPTVRAQEMQWEDYEPRSTLVVKEHTVTRAKYPFVDAHAHQWEIGDRPESAIKDLVAEMDALNMAVMVNLSGGSGETLRKNVETTERYAPGRFVHFANIDFSTIDDPDFGTKAAERLREDVANGARGLKIFKTLGMEVFYEDGTRVPTDDPRLDPIWETAGELGIPVLIHTGDPAPFWEPQDRFNERWFELKERPRRKRSPEPSWETIMGEHWNLIRKHPNTTFISAHLSWL